MSTIITDFPPVTTYDLCDPTGIKEADFQEVAIRILRQLNPACSVFPFHPNVHYDDAVWNPDLAIVDRDHGFWFIVEVEIATHHLEKHVLPQVTAFCEGIYADDAADQLAKGLGVTQQKAKTLFSIIPREVVVVSNHYDARWKEKLTAIGVRHVVIATYKNRITAQTVHKVDGELLPAHRSLGFGRVRATDGVIVTQVGSFWKEGVFELTGPEGTANWLCSISDGRAWLMKERGLIAFHDSAIVQMILRDDGSILVKIPYAQST